MEDQVVEMALEQSELSPRSLIIQFIVERLYFVPEATVYLLVMAHDLVTSPADVIVKAAEVLHTKINGLNEMWQTYFTHFNIIGWGRMCPRALLVLLLVGEVVSRDGAARACPGANAVLRKASPCLIQAELRGHRSQGPASGSRQFNKV